MATTRITVASGSLIELGYRRGDYVTVADRAMRIMRVSSATLTTRTVPSIRGIAWLGARIEDWILWPLDDLRSRFRVRG